MVVLGARTGQALEAKAVVLHYASHIGETAYAASTLFPLIDAKFASPE
jgi:hypothetical protein